MNHALLLLLLLTLHLPNQELLMMAQLLFLVLQYHQSRVPVMQHLLLLLLQLLHVHLLLLHDLFKFLDLVLGISLFLHFLVSLASDVGQLLQNHITASVVLDNQLIQFCYFLFGCYQILKN